MFSFIDLFLLYMKIRLLKCLIYFCPEAVILEIPPGKIQTWY